MIKSNSIITIGARNYASEEREANDFYATPPKAVNLILNEEKFNNNIWEVCCGKGHISEVLVKNGFNVYNTDIIDRGYKGLNKEINFFDCNYNPFNNQNFDILTNPPYKYAMEFAKHSLDILNTGCKVALFLKLTFLEGKKRKEFFNKYPFKTLYVSSSRLTCVKNGDFDKYKNSPSATGWYVWEKGYKGQPTIKWIN